MTKREAVQSCPLPASEAELQHKYEGHAFRLLVPRNLLLEHNHYATIDCHTWFRLPAIIVTWYCCTSHPHERIRVWRLSSNSLVMLSYETTNQIQLHVIVRNASPIPVKPRMCHAVSAIPQFMSNYRILKHNLTYACNGLIYQELGWHFPSWVWG